MPMNGYSVGRDVALTLNDPILGVLRFAIRTGFSAKQETNDIKVKRLDGIVDHLVLPDGWTGTFDFERRNGSLDDYIASREADYYQGVNSQTLKLTETITNSDGTISQYRYTGLVLKYEDAGSWTGDQTVKQKVSWMASRRLTVTG